MVSLLSKIFIKDREDYKNPVVRNAYGTLCSVLGIFLNILMFIGKYIAGVLSNSISITADAFNNLSDAGSSVITLLGFRIAGMKPDPNHPFGHGRMEYLSGLAVSAIIVVMGFELLQSSIKKIMNPEPVEGSILVVCIMLVSILVKLYMAFYNSRISKKINSAAMKSVATDSISDTISTLVVLISMGISHFTSFNIDAYAGLVVSALIIYAGASSAKDTISPLLGNPPDHEFVMQIKEIVRRQPDIVGIHDLIVHNYGPGRTFVSLHAEVPGHLDIFDLHDEIDEAERMLKEELNCLAVIHMDPVATDDKKVMEYKKRINEIVKSVDQEFSIHDFRMVPGPTHTNLIFDLVVPTKYHLSFEQVNELASNAIKKECKNCVPVITVEQSYI